jgi:hypothetical protein
MTVYLQLALSDHGNTTPLRIGSFVTRIYYNHPLTNIADCNLLVQFTLHVLSRLIHHQTEQCTTSRVRLKPDGTRWRREGKWRGNWWMEWIASTLHNTSEHGVSSIANAYAHNSAASGRLYWRPRRFKWTRPFRRKTKSGFRSCVITFQAHYIK